MTPAAPTPGDWLSALKTSHERLAADVGELTVKELAGPSYDREWSIAQVLSHLGSGADIFSLVLRAGRRGEPAPELADIESIWARWNARTPEDQVVYALVADRTLVAEFEELDEAQRESWHLSFFGSEQDFGDLLRYRLSEHALHTWDAEVPRHPAATLAPDATALLVDTLPQFVGRLGPPAGSPGACWSRPPGPNAGCCWWPATRWNCTRWATMTTPGPTPRLRPGAHRISDCRPRPSSAWWPGAWTPSTPRPSRATPTSMPCADSSPDSDPTDPELSTHTTSTSTEQPNAISPQPP